MYALGVFSRIKIYGLKKKLICYLSLNCMQISCSHFQSVICIYNFFFPLSLICIIFVKKEIEKVIYPFLLQEWLMLRCKLKYCRELHFSHWYSTILFSSRNNIQHFLLNVLNRFSSQSSLVSLEPGSHSLLCSLRNVHADLQFHFRQSWAINCTD